MATTFPGLLDHSVCPGFGVTWLLPLSGLDMDAAGHGWMQQAETRKCRYLTAEVQTTS